MQLGDDTTEYDVTQILEKFHNQSAQIWRKTNLLVCLHLIYAHPDYID